MTRDRTRVLRFGAVGIVNTVIDFALFLGLSVLGAPILLANLVSTSVALGVSFVLNRRITFRARARAGRQLAFFLVVTLVGLWVVQPIVILGVVALGVQSGVDEALMLVLGKLVATAVTLVWNYLLYARFVFRD